MPITASLGALTNFGISGKAGQIYLPGSRYFPTTVGAGTPYGFQSTGTTPTNVINVASSTGFTVEYWVRYTAFTGPSATPLFIGNFISGYNGYWWLGVTSTGAVDFTYNGGPPNSITTVANHITLNTWYNIALVLTPNGSNTDVSIYVNGTARLIKTPAPFSTAYVITIPTSSLIYNVTNPVIIAPSNQTPSQTSYWDEIRISNIARYSGNYTVATSEFTPDANTQLLLHFTYIITYGITTPIVDSSQNNLTFVNISPGAGGNTQANSQYYKF